MKQTVREAVLFLGRIFQRHISTVDRSLFRSLSKLLKFTEKKIMPFYAVRVGRNPGIYQTWPECQAQVTGFPKPIFKKFAAEVDALKFVQGQDPTPSSPKKGGMKFYAVRNGKKPGIYLTWPECQAQITGWKRPEFKKFDKKEDALLFIESTNSLKRPFHTSAGADEVPHKTAKLEAVDGKRTKFLDNLPEEKKPTDTGFVGKYTGSIFPDDEGVHVYTDGGCFNNGQSEARAGIGVFWNTDDPSNVSERLPGRPTNNRAEIHAAVKAVQQAKAKGIHNLILHTDSMFLINGITKWIKGWKRKDWKLASGKPVINKADFEALDAEMSGINIKWMYIKGHSGDAGNDAVDILAKKGASKPMS